MKHNEFGIYTVLQLYKMSSICLQETRGNVDLDI